MVDGAGHDGASDFGMGHGGHADLGIGHGGGHHGGHADFGHGAGLGFSDFGHGYGHGFGYGFHMFDGHGHGGHITAEALMVSHSFCHPQGNMHVSSITSPGHFDHGHVNSLDGIDGVDKGALQEKLRLYKLAIEKAKNDPDRRYFGAHVLGHGHVDVQALFVKVAGVLDAQRFCNRVGNFSPVDLMPMVITDWDKYAPPFPRRRPPAGWYPKAEGLTHVFKQYWQVRRPIPWFWPVKAPDGFDRSQNTYFEVSLVTWFYADVGDYETRLDISVVSIPVLDQFDKRWGYRASPLLRHQRAAAAICEKIFETLKSAAPPDFVRRRRAKVVEMMEELRKKQDQGKTGTGAGTGAGTGSGKTNPPSGSGVDLDNVLSGDTVDDGVGSGTEPLEPAPTTGDVADAGVPDGGGAVTERSAPVVDAPPSAAAPAPNTGSSAPTADGSNKVVATAVIPTPRYKGR